MPHKVNPIDFENSGEPLEGELGSHVPRRLRDDLAASARDLSQTPRSSATWGAALAHCLIGYSKAGDGLATVVPNETVMREELAATPEVIGEAVQTILRREGDTDAYERVKDLTRGKRVTLDDFRDLFDDLDVDEGVREELKALTPAGYVGVADELVDDRRVTPQEG